MICALSHSGMDVACNAVSTGVSGGKYDMHSGCTLVLVIDRNISERYFCVVFVFQGGRPTIVSVVIRFLCKFELRFGDMRSVLECRIQTSVRGIRFCLGAVSRAPGGDLVVHTLVSTVLGFIGIAGAVLCPWTMSIQLS